MLRSAMAFGFGDRFFGNAPQQQTPRGPIGVDGDFPPGPPMGPPPGFTTPQRQPMGAGWDGGMPGFDGTPNMRPNQPHPQDAGVGQPFQGPVGGGPLPATSLNDVLFQIGASLVNTNNQIGQLAQTVQQWPSDGTGGGHGDGDRGYRTLKPKKEMTRITAEKST